MHVPGLADGDRRRVALEAYPGMLARAVTRASYKSDSRSLQTPAREAARREIVAALERGRHALKTSVSFDTRTMRRQLLDDASGDSLDAVLCAVQAGWAAARAGWGLPRHIPRCEGWIASAVA